MNMFKLHCKYGNFLKSKFEQKFESFVIYFYQQVVYPFYTLTFTANSAIWNYLYVNILNGS